jgi:hypothetical protein
VRWIALRQQGDRTSAALSGGGRHPLTPGKRKG